MRRGQNSGAVFYGWWIVLVTAIGLSMSYGPIVTFTFGVFFKPLSQEFGWNRAQVSLAFSLSLLVMSVAFPFVGRLVDRFGARRVIVPSVLLFGFGLISFSLLSASLWHLYAIYLVLGVVGGGTAPVPYSGVTGVLAFAAAFLVGLGLGAEGDIIAYLVSRYFGLRAFGEIYGYAFAAFTLGGVVGPLLIGVGFDSTGSYGLVLSAFVVAALIAAALMTRLGPYRPWVTAEAAAVS